MEDSATALGRVERWTVSVVGAGALLGVPLAVWTVIAPGMFYFSTPTVRVEGLRIGASSYPGFLAASDAPVDAGYESAWVEVANLPSHIRALLWAEEALPAMLTLSISIAVAWLALALLRGNPFTRAFPVALGVVAIALVGSGLGAQLIASIARAETVAFLGPPDLLVADGSGVGSEGFYAFSGSIDLGPVGWGLGIALVAAAFSIGTRLQRDSRGLV